MYVCERMGLLNKKVSLTYNLASPVASILHTYLRSS